MLSNEQGDKMLFKKTDLAALATGEGAEGFEVISDIIHDRSRWAIHYRLVFKHDGKFFESIYRVGATENQDESPYEYGNDEIPCKEVRPVEKTVTVYE